MSTGILYHAAVMAERPRFLVTAGNTREMIDRVRDWGNVFTGNTGFAIAEALATVGEVDLLTSNRSHLAGAKGVRAAAFTSHAELKDALSALLRRNRYDAVFMTAAIADYAPAGAYEVVERRPGAEPGIETWQVRDVSAGKIKSTHRALAFLGRPTEKLIDLFRGEWGFRGMLVKFKLEVDVAPDKLIEIARQSRRHSGADYIIANSLDMVTGDNAGAFLLGDGVQEWVPRTELPGRLARLATDSAAEGA
jgi:phosphopantothenoylcysteine synthetase/decarboxylase